MQKILKTVLASTLFISMAFTAIAQETEVYFFPQVTYADALALFEQQNYVSAAKMF